MNKFLGTYNLPRLNYIEIENLNKPVIRKDIESVIKYLLAEKNPRTDCYTDEFYKILKEELTTILLILFSKN